MIIHHERVAGLALEGRFKLYIGESTDTVDLFELKEDGTLSSGLQVWRPHLRLVALAKNSPPQQVYVVKLLIEEE